MQCETCASDVSSCWDVCRLTCVLEIEMIAGHVKRQQRKHDDVSGWVLVKEGKAKQQNKKMKE